jgi:hypothetical protein
MSAANTTVFPPAVISPGDLELAYRLRCLKRFQGFSEWLLED